MALSKRDCLQMVLNCFDDCVRQRQILFLGVPMLMEKGDSLARGIENQLFRQPGSCGEMRQLVLRELIETLGPANIQGCIAVGYIRDGRYKIVSGGLKHVRFHDLRHTYASLLIQAGASLSLVQRLMGHSTIAITNDLYGHLTTEHLEAAVRLLDKL